MTGLLWNVTRDSWDLEPVEIKEQVVEMRKKGEQDVQGSGRERLRSSLSRRLVSQLGTKQPLQATFRGLTVLWREPGE
ncbi:hypothetical protein N7462_008170 [Penicillium macrosclerotiorum]|uniref:uncharacterized protein n=1 Tax=Penicillium macrosclerotiorum TaxID=303699 RepID=UPI0025494BE6|nr:uncharacterized protein N7462_008170 [Penicillium macrosclerotiorum]KAJ5679926.1 hypothetical protein N7462_008170 [Penicillium macrosclerotiorum]